MNKYSKVFLKNDLKDNEYLEVRSMKSKKKISGLKRNTIDKFYTNKKIVELCYNYIKDNINILNSDLIIEPSAGNGSFIDKLKELSKNNIYYDIKPEHGDIIKQDYLDLEVSDFKKYNNIHIIGNPPFGRQSSLAKKFIKKSCEFAKSISFILPKSFKKDSFRRCFKLNYWLVFETDLPDNSFLLDDKEYDVPCIFQIWEKREENRKLPIILSPNGYEFVKKNKNHDISFRRVGVYAGKISKDTGDKSEQSHYFIKFNNNKKLNKNLDKLKKINFVFNNTVGPKSISKQELIKEFNKYLK